MKKVLFVFAIATSLVACGGSTSTEATTDSTSVDSVLAVDTMAVPADTTVVVDSAQ